MSAVRTLVLLWILAGCQEPSSPRWGVRDGFLRAPDDRAVILRGVNLLGINSVFTPRPLRLAVWQRLAGDLKPRHLDTIVTRTVSLDELSQAFEPYVKGAVTGRAVVKIG